MVWTSPYATVLAIVRKTSLLATLDRSGLADTVEGFDRTNMSGDVSVVCVLACLSLVVFGVFVLMQRVITQHVLILYSTCT